REVLRHSSRITPPPRAAPPGAAPVDDARYTRFRLARGGSFFCPEPVGRPTPHHGAAMARGDGGLAVTPARGGGERRHCQPNKSKRNNPDRITLRKYCKWCRSHTSHRETR